MKTRRRTGWQALSLWLCTFLGGAVTGTGVFLLAQVRVVRHLRERVHSEIGGIERFFGKMTFLWRGTDEKLLLALDEIPEEYLLHSETIAKWLMGLGALGIAIVVPLWLRFRWKHP